MTRPVKLALAHLFSSIACAMLVAFAIVVIAAPAAHAGLADKLKKKVEKTTNEQVDQPC